MEDIDVTLATIGFESKNEIDRLLKPFIGHVKQVILGDGAFDFYPTDHKFSNDKWMQYAADKYKNDFDKIITYEYSGKQVDKRQKYLDLCETEWLIVMDTDDYIHPQFQMWDVFYTNLLNISKILSDAVYMIWEYIPNETLWPKQGNQFASDVWRRSARIHRWPNDQRYCMDTHYMWCPKGVTDEELLDWQLKHRDADNPKQLVGRVPIEGIRIAMDRTLRTDEQIKGGAYWAFMNQHAEQSRIYYKNAKLLGTPIPEGYKSWEEFENAPHTFDEHGARVDLRNKKD